MLDLFHASRGRILIDVNTMNWYEIIFCNTNNNVNNHKKPATNPTIINNNITHKNIDQSTSKQTKPNLNNINNNDYNKNCNEISKLQKPRIQ